MSLLQERTDDCSLQTCDTKTRLKIQFCVRMSNSLKHSRNINYSKALLELKLGLLKHAEYEISLFKIKIFCSRIKAIVILSLLCFWG